MDVSYSLSQTVEINATTVSLQFLAFTSKYVAISYCKTLFEILVKKVSVHVNVLWKKKKNNERN